MAAVPVTASPEGHRHSSTVPVRIITPHSGLEGFGSAIRSLTSGFRQATRLAWRFFLRDTRADYRQSLLGYVWLIVPALANVVVWTFLSSEDVIRVDSGPVPYPVFVLTGTILWTAFNASVMGMLGVMGAARGLFAKVNFPHESLVYAAFFKAATDALIASSLLLPAFLIYGLELRSTLLLYPLALLASLVLGAALGLILVPVASLYSDIGRAVQLVLRFGFFVTPVIFALPAAGTARFLMMMNPVTPVVVSGRAWVTGSGEALPVLLALVTLGAILLAAVGLLTYKVALPYVVERLGG